jgi:DNA polymerase elongation subunit (family B)
MSHYTKEQIAAVVALKKAGVSHRAIAKQVFGKKSMASSVFYILYEHLYTKPEEKEGPRVLIFDIETSPEIGYVWGRFKQFLAPVQVKQRSFMLTWSAKWLGEEEILDDAIINYRQTDDAYGEPDDLEIVTSMWNLLDRADVVVAHNGIRFDLPYLNSRFVYHNLGMPSPFKVVDTCKIAKKYFRFPANSLKELGIYLGIEVPKLDTDFQLWVDCMEGKKEAWEYMVEYNQYDVKLLEEVYLRLRSYDKSHPNMSLYYDDDKVRDPVTGSTDVVEDGFAYTASSKFPAFKGPEGHSFRSSKKVKGVKSVNAQ